MKRFVALAVFGATVVAATASVGCKKDPPQQPQPLQPMTGYPPTTGYPPAGNTGYPATPGPVATPAPTPTQAPPTTSTGCDPSVAAGLQPLLQGQVAQHAPGAKPEGSAVCGMLQEGQSLQVTVTLAAGGSKCYTGVAIGAPTFTQLDLQLVAAPPPPLPPTTLSQSSGGGPLPVMAGKPNCFKNLLPVPMQANFKLTATKGSGPAMAQLYMKLRARSPPGEAGRSRRNAIGAAVGGNRRSRRAERPVVSRAIVRGHVEYPSRLAELRSPPAAFYVRGTWPQPPGVAVVGTRRPGPRAEAFARTLGAALARAGLVLWSGGALGIDAAAHEGALDAGGVTVLVAGGALDAPYPACHRDLYERVEASGGALVSLLADGQRPRPWIFLERNRLLAALTLGTAIVECPLKSGARSTAAAARHLGRPVWMAAQPPWEPELALAVREEVRLGARLLFCVDDLFASSELANACAASQAEAAAGASARRASRSSQAGYAVGTLGVTGGAAIEATSGPVSEATSEAVSEATSEAVSKAASEAVSEATSGAALEATGRAAIEATSRAARGAAIEAASGAVVKATSRAGRGGARGRGGAARGVSGVPEGAEQVWLALVKARAGAHVDEICERTGLGVGQVQYGLTLLVLGGWVDEGLPGQFWPRGARRRGGLGFPTPGGGGRCYL